ncbi:MAG: hypothetical protein N3A38_06605 [Planctomycetota bacterium]|nr:hypothetical protein [Planctomycetota bacterium]
MSDNTPLYALIAFILISLVFGIIAYSQHNAFYGPVPEEDSKPAILAKETEALARVEQQVAELKAKLRGDRVLRAGIRQEIQETELRTEAVSHMFAIYKDGLKRRQQLAREANELAKQGMDLKTEIMRAKEATRKAIQDDRAKISEEADKVIRRNEQLKLEAQQAIDADRKADEAEAKKHAKRMNFENSYRDDLRSQLTTLIQRERETTVLDPDGEVILSDPMRNFAVINIGSSAGVKRGFVFEVYRELGAGQKMVKGYLEVTKTQPSMSECMILERIVHLPRDPLTGYTASSPEELYSPYATKGGGKAESERAQPLVGRPKTVVLGQVPMDPIVKGDLIVNPFFDPGRTLTFAIAGQGGIKYSKSYIERVIKEYGGQIRDISGPDSIGPGIDFLIAQREAKEEVKTATNMGIKVLYEFELFRFLDSR